MKNSRYYIPELDSLRFLAFALIFIHHSTITNIPLVSRIKALGWIGVDIFFCLSAFLLTRLLCLERIKTGTIDRKKFFIRRALRIWPLYLTYSIIAILFALAQGIITPENWFRIIGLLTFTENIFASAYSYNPIRFTGHLWTISYEEQFYLVLPFVIPLLVRQTQANRDRALMIVLFIGWCIRFLFIYLKVKHPAIWVLPVTHFESIIAGLYLAFLTPSPTVARSTLPYFIACIFSAGLIAWLPGTGMISYHLMILYPSIGIAAGCSLYCILHYKSALLHSMFTNSAIVYLGKISFGLYVFHIFSINFTDYCLRKAGITESLLTIILSFIVTIILAVASYRLLESRFLKIKERFTIIPSH